MALIGAAWGWQHGEGSGTSRAEQGAQGGVHGAQLGRAAAANSSTTETGVRCVVQRGQELSQPRAGLLPGAVITTSRVPLFDFRRGWASACASLRGWCAGPGPAV